MTVIVQPGTDSNGNPQPMVYDSDTGKVIVDSNGYVLNGGQRLVNVPTVSGYVNTPKTQTSGIYEAWMYAINVATPSPVEHGAAYMTPIKILPGMYIVEEPTTLPLTNSAGLTILNPTIRGDSSMAPWIMSAHQGGYTFTIEAIGAVNYRIENIQPCTPSQFPYTPPGYTSPPTPDGFLKIDASTNTSSIDGWMFEGYNIDISAAGWSETPLYINGAEFIVMYNFEGYGGGTTYGNAFLTASVIILDSSNLAANNPSITLGGYNISTSSGTKTVSAEIYLTNCYSGNGAVVPPILIVNGGIGYMIQKPFVAPLQYGSSLVSQGHGGIVELDGGIWYPTSDNNYSLFYFPSATTGITQMGYARIHLNIAGTSSTVAGTIISGGGASIAYNNIEFDYVPDYLGASQYFNLPLYGSNPVVLPFSALSSANGTTAGTVNQQMIKYDIYYKKMIYYFSGYENDTTTNQTINHWAPFSTIAAISFNSTGLTISASTTGITITAPDSTTTYSGIVIVEGY